MAELKAQSKATKEAFKGGLVAWRKRSRDTKATSNAEDEDGSTRENRRGGDGAETCG
ncbi:hypothetical protein LX36DRAFT_653004 [Colletotrichum falcatum]|nr:hypothetical protein LX36DRAFT_653004 [Colletotrichum falcatum]